MAGALDGLRVVDMTSVVMGPSMTQLLGDHGAEIIKVEIDDGDSTRHARPKVSDDMGWIFLQLNRNKRSVVLDLKQPAQMEAFHKLLQSADIFVSSVRPGALTRLGLSPAALLEINPRLVSIGLVGFGSGGPYAGKPVYEDLVQALTAIPSLLMTTGSIEPQYVPVSFNDRAVGMAAVGAAMIAIYHRDRTGEGQHVEVPMFETMAQFVIGDHMGGNAFEPPAGPPGYKRTLTPERRPYRTADGYVGVIVYTDAQWRSFARVIGRPNLLDEDARLRDLAARTDHSAVAYSIIREVMPLRATEEWLKILDEADVPAARLHTLDSIFTDPHLEATGFFEHTQHPTEGPLLTAKGPSSWSKTPPQLRRPAPHLGEHTIDVLIELGYTEEEARAMTEAAG